MKQLLLSLLLVLSASGCAHISKNKTAKQVPTFESTGSFCLDAYLLRSSASGCEDWRVREVEGLKELKCSTKSHNQKDDWLDSTFVIFQKSNTLPLIPRFFPICVDEHHVFGIITTENVK